MRLRSLIALLAGAALLSACGSTDGDTIKIGYPAETANHADLYVCKDAGIFAKHGLDVELTLLKTSSQLLAAMTSGSVQIGTGDGDAIARGAQKNAPVEVIALKLPTSFVEVWGKPGLNSVADLSGQRVGVTAPGSVTDRSTRELLAREGVDATIVNLSDGPGLLAAGRAGRVDALVTSPPRSASARTWGWHKITDTTSLKTAAGVYAVSDSYAKKSPKKVQAFADAEVECLTYLQDHRARTVKAIASHTHSTTAEAQYAYDFFKNIFVTDPTVDIDILQRDFDTAAGGSGGPDAKDFVDNSFVEKAEQQ